jgi:phosphate uptake regulator
MIRDLLNLFGRSPGLVLEAREEAVEMLKRDRAMFDLAMHAVMEEYAPDVRERVRAMDAEVNRHEIEVREKVFEHLVVSRGRDLTESVILLHAVGDIERIGDNSKNIVTLLEMLPEKLVLGEYEEKIRELRTVILDNFDKAAAALKDDDQAAARHIAEQHEVVREKCRGSLKEIFSKTAGEELVEKRLVAIVLALRYMKRISSHLKNIALAVLDPIERLGVRREEA